MLLQERAGERECIRSLENERVAGAWTRARRLTAQRLVFPEYLAAENKALGVSAAMCGRTACTLHPDKLRLACSYQPKNGGSKGDGKFQKARWVDQPGSKSYQPSHNIAPTDMLPVLVHGVHASHEDEERILMPMRWGLVPFFHKGDVADMKLTTFNARSEEFLTKPMFSVPFKKGQRCVVVCDGYYEWKKEGGSKKPYFLYTEQDKKWDICADINGVGDEELWSETDGWKGPNLAMMAGIFEARKSGDSGPMYSCTVLTQAASERLRWLHPRMPVFLRTPDAVQDWLSVGETPEQSLLDLIGPVDSLAWHPVSADINNARNKQATNAPLSAAKRSASAGFMSAWLLGGTQKKTQTGEPGKEAKRFKRGESEQETKGFKREDSEQGTELKHEELKRETEERGSEAPGQEAEQLKQEQQEQEAELGKQDEQEQETHQSEPGDVVKSEN